MRECFKTVGSIALFTAMMLLLTTTARSGDFIPDEDPPPVVIVKELKDLNSRMDRIERKLDAALPKAVTVQTVTKTTQPVLVSAARQSYVTGQGHTHTCTRCGTTWDHGAVPGHNCPNCGEAQYVQDTAGSATTYLRAAGYTRATMTSSGCSGSGCPSSTTYSTYGSRRTRR